jgi:hypothetical protein
MVLVLLAACAPTKLKPQATPTPSPAETTPEPTPTDDETEDDQNEDATGDVTTPEGLEDGVYVGKSDEDERGAMAKSESPLQMKNYRCRVHRVYRRR